MPLSARSVLAAATGALTRVQSYGAFLGAFIREHKTIGAIAPTSRGVGQRIASLAGVARATSVAELGAGTGAITRPLLEALAPGATLRAFEVYPPFVDALRESIDDPRFTLVAESAERIPAASSLDSSAGFDAVVSSLPFSLMTGEVTDAILHASAMSLRPGGVMVALQYRPTYLMPHLRKHFATVERHFCLLNLPPAMLLRARDPYKSE